MQAERNALAWRLAETIAWWRFRERSSDPAVALGEREARPRDPGQELWSDMRRFQLRLRLRRPQSQWTDADRQDATVVERMEVAVQEWRRALWAIVGRENKRLRTAALQPRAALDDAARFEERQSDATLMAMLEPAIERRASTLQEFSAYPDVPAADFAGGRIVTYLPRDSIADGAAMNGSLGFFNAYDEPSWDLWLHFAEGRLYAWVPADMIDNVAGGIEASAVANIGWASEDEARLFIAVT